MKNIANMMKQAQQMQSKMQEMQSQLSELEVHGSSGGGMVEIILNGKGEARKAIIDPSLINDGDKSLLEDLIVAAINDAKAKVDIQVKEEMSKLTGGIQLPPGMQLPF